MEFFDKIGKKASEAYKVTADKTGKIAKETKLKMAINENKSKINDLYEEIGKKIYENHVREEKENLDEFLKEECKKYNFYYEKDRNDTNEKVIPIDFRKNSV